MEKAMTFATLIYETAGRIARIRPKVKIPGHAEEVLAAARALSSPVGPVDRDLPLIC